MEDAKFKALSKPQQDVVMKIAAEAERQGVNPKLAIAIAEAETGGAFSHYKGDKILTSPAGAQGLMQLLPSTVRLYNEKMNADIDPLDENSNIKGGVFILKDLLTKYKSPRNAVNLYNASPKANATFLELYKTDPDAAILSLPKETRNYALRVSKNFNLDDDNETGLFNAQSSEVAPKQDNPNDPFAAGVPLADKAREGSNTEEVEKEPVTLLEKASALANEINPATAAAFGAVANVAGAQFVKPPLTPAEISSQTAQKKLELERANLNKATSYSQAEIEDIYKQSQGELDRVKNEQRLAKARLEGLPKAPPAMEMPEAPAAFDEPSRTKSGASGAVNYVNAMSDNVPEVLANQALNMRKDNPRGGQAIIDANTLAIQKQADLGMGDYGLTRTASGVQLALPPTTVAERQADIDKQNQANQAELEQRAEQTRIQQEAQAQQFEQQRLAHEAEVERLRQERATIGSQHNQYASELKDIKPLQKAVTQAEKAVELAKYNAKLKAQNQPITPQYLLNKGMAVSRPLVGGLAGAAGVMSLQEALERFKAGDTSEGVLKIIQASSAAAMLTPPLNKTLSRTRKTGALGAIGSYGYDFGRRFLKDSPEE